jgi:hypothetical protein
MSDDSRMNAAMIETMAALGRGEFPSGKGAPPSVPGDVGCAAPKAQHPKATGKRRKRRKGRRNRTRRERKAQR